MNFHNHDGLTPSTLSATADAVSTQINENSIGAAGALKGLGETVLAGESFAAQEESFGENINADARNIVKGVIDTLESDEVFLNAIGAGKDLTAAQKNAVALSLMSTSNGAEYRKLLNGMGKIHGINSENSVETDISAYSSFASFGSSEEVLAGESFENVNLYGVQSINVIAAVRQAKLSAFSEMFAPTVTVPPSKQSIAITARLPLIQQAMRHSTGTKLFDTKRQSVVQARYDSAILANNVTSVKAVRRETGDTNDNTSWLAPVADVPVRKVEHNGTVVSTSPILMGRTVDILSLNSTTGINGIVEDETSTISASARVGKIYFQVSNGTDTEVLAIDVNNMPGLAFNRAGNQANDKLGMSFNYATTHFPIASLDNDGKVSYKTVKNIESTLLAGLKTAGIAINLNLALAGQLNLESGKASVSPTLEATVTDGAINENGNTTIVAADDTAMTDALTDITFTPIFWDPAMSTTNTNWARSGKQVDYNEFTYPYEVRTLSPFHTKVPTDSEPTAEQINDLSACVTQQADNNVALALLDYVDVVRRAALSHTGYHDEIGTLGAGAHLLRRPYYKRVDLDALNDINSTETNDKIANFSAMFTDRIRNECAIADQEAGVQGAIDAITGHSGRLPTVVAGGDLLLRQNLLKTGDPRTLGNYKEFQIEACNLDEYKGRCVVMMGLKDDPGANPLGVGQRWYTPDVIRTAQISGDTTTKRVMIIPHYTIVFNVPVVIDVHVKNLYELFSQSTYTYVAGKGGEAIPTAPEAVSP